MPQKLSIDWKGIRYNKSSLFLSIKSTTGTPGLTHAFVGDGVCNDETNIAECDYDGLDCCLNPNMVGDGICNDGTNHIECNYDGGDCCLLNVNTDSCSECNCLASGVITSPGFPGNYDNYLDMTWLIHALMGQIIEINFLSFDLEAYFVCG